MPGASGPWRAWGQEGPLVREILAQGGPAGEPGPPPRGTSVDRLPGGGFGIRIGSWPFRLKVRLERERLKLRGVFRGVEIPLGSLASIGVSSFGLVFHYGKERYLFGLPDPVIQAWLRALILRNVVTREPGS